MSIALQRPDFKTLSRGKKHLFFFCELPSIVLFHILCVISSPSFFVRPLLFTSCKANAYRIKASWNPSINILTCNQKKEVAEGQNNVSKTPLFISKRVKRVIFTFTMHCHIGERNREVILVYVNVSFILIFSHLNNKNHYLHKKNK